MSDTPPDPINLHFDPETWAERSPVPAIERRSFTPDPDAARYLPPALRPSGAVPTIPQPPNDAPLPLEASTLPAPPTPPDDVPQQGNAAAAIVGALATPGPDGQAPLGKLLGVTGGPLAIVLGVVVWLFFQGQEQTKATITDAMTRSAAEHKLERERDQIERERQEAAQEAAHTKLHDQERRELDARLDKLLQVVERQEAKLDDLSVKVGELQPRKR